MSTPGRPVPSPSASVLFLCLGNICRSPLAEGALKSELARRGLAWHVESAGTGAWHATEPPDPRSISVARRHGVDISAQRARQLASRDFEVFDLIVAMDRGVAETAERRRPPGAASRRARIILFMELVPPDLREGPDVPDPYYGNHNEFEAVWAIVALGTPRLVDAVLERK